VAMTEKYVTTENWKQARGQERKWPYNDPHHVAYLSGHFSFLVCS
jgi:hypothetical protein